MLQNSPTYIIAPNHSHNQKLATGPAAGPSPCASCLPLYYLHTCVCVPRVACQQSYIRQSCRPLKYLSFTSYFYEDSGICKPGFNLSRARCLWRRWGSNQLSIAISSDSHLSQLKPYSTHTLVNANETFRIKGKRIICLPRFNVLERWKL